MGEVYKAFDPTLQRVLAVKTIRPDIDRPEYLDRMMREAQACARLSHPNIVTIFEAGKADDVVYIAMEFLEGENLAQRLERQGLSFEDKLRALIKVLEALQHAHALDVVHRDIKPSNIHVMPDGTIKLMDFGLARVLTADTLTASGNVLGTPHYASPEQLKGETIDRRTDIYSVGVMAYEMLAGRRPFEPDNDTISSVIIKVISQPPRPMDTGMSRMLPDIETIVSKALAKQPADRFQSADDMRRALVAFLDTSRARLSAIESAAGATMLLPSTMARQQDAVPTITAARAGEVSTTATAPAAPASVAAPAGSPAQSGSTRWMWVGGAAAAAIVIAVISVGLPSTNAEPSSDVAAASGSAPPAVPAASNPPPEANATTAPANAVTPTPAPVKTAPVATKNADPVPPGVSKPVESPEAPRDLNAKLMFASTDAAAAPGLRFRMMLQNPSGQAIDVDPARDFHTGERIKFAFESNIDGYLYVAQQGTSGNWMVLFPHPEIAGGLNKVKRFEEHEVPNDNWFTLSGNPGEEQLFVFLSREPLNTLPGFDRPVRAFEPSPPSLVAQLQGTIASRDLILSKDSAATKGVQATYIVNKAELGKAVTAKFTISHKP
jgi:serine/threonine-protein kinase